MDRRASELEKIEKRVSHLREQLERRGNHKPDIIDLQVKVLVNEAEGLGFFSDSESTGFIFSPMGERLRIMGPEMGMRFDSPRAALPTPTPAPPAAPAQVIEPARPLNGEAPR
jgi:hypothetical protein